MPFEDAGYFPGLGNSVSFVSPGGIEGIVGCLSCSSMSGLFSMSYDAAATTEAPYKLTRVLTNAMTAEWPHTFVVPKYATTHEYKYYPLADHFT
jgi:L-fucose isomerase